MRLIALALSAALLTSGCATKVELQSKFDAASVAKLLSPGTNKVSGSALIRQVGGGVVTCAGYPVYLMPSSEYAREWARYVYESEERGFFNSSGRGISFKNLDPSFVQAVKETTCDAQGFFSFREVADGDFFLFTKINWLAAGQMQGGSIMRAVSLRGAQSVEVVLSP